MTHGTALLFLVAIIGLALLMLAVLLVTLRTPPRAQVTRWTRETPEGPP